MAAKFSGHDKRVTLNLALQSHAGTQVPGLIQALEQARLESWDLLKLPQEQVEIIYSAFTEEFEAQVRAEFRADPAYLHDLGLAAGVCPLCGHVGCRWIFRLENLAEGSSIECGSECIITYGIAVKGAETAEHARKILEGQIRKAIRALQIKEWHAKSGFKAEWFGELQVALSRISLNLKLGQQDRISAYYKKRDLKKLERFYTKTGWLNTKLRWTDFRRIANFARVFDLVIQGIIPHVAPWVGKPGKAAEVPVEPEVLVAEVIEEVPEVLVAEVIEEVKEVPEVPVQQELPFLSVVNGMLFGKKE